MPGFELRSFSRVVQPLTFWPISPSLKLSVLMGCNESVHTGCSSTALSYGYKHQNQARTQALRSSNYAHYFCHAQWLTWVFASSIIYIHLEILHIMTYMLITTSRYKATPKAFHGLSVHSCSSWSSNCIGFCFHFSTWLRQANAHVSLPVAYPLGFLIPHSGLQTNFGFSLQDTPVFVCCDCCLFVVVVCFWALR